MSKNGHSLRGMSEAKLLAHNKRIADYRALPKCVPATPMAPKARKSPVSKPDAPREPLEAEHQAALVEWWRLACHGYGYEAEALFSIPNGAHLAGGAKLRGFKMHKMKQGGLRPGVPDLFLAVPRWDIQAGGLFIEMKRKGGKISDTQSDMVCMLRELGYHAVVCWNFVEAQRAITGYLCNQ